MALVMSDARSVAAEVKPESSGCLRGAMYAGATAGRPAAIVKALANYRTSPLFIQIKKALLMGDDLSSENDVKT